MADVKALEARIASLEKEKRQKNFQFTALEALLKKTKGEIDKLKEATAPPADGGPAGSSGNEERLVAATADLERCEADLQEALSKGEAARAEAEVAKREAEAAKGEVQAAEGARVEAELASKAVREELEEVKGQVEKLRGELRDTRDEAEGLSGTLREAQKQLEGVTYEREEAEEVKEALARAQEKVAEMEALLSGSDEMAVELQCLKKAVGSMEEDKSRKVLELEELRRELEEQTRKLDAKNEDAKDDNEAIAAIQKEADTTRNAYEAIVEDLKISLNKANCRSDLLQQQLDQASSKAHGESEKLREGEAVLVENQKTLEELLGKISKLEESVGSETMRAQREHELRLVAEGKLNSVMPEMDRLKAQVEHLGNELEQSSRASEEQAKAAKDKMHEMEVAVNAHEAKSSRLSQEAQTAKERADELEGVCSDLEARLQEATKSAPSSSSRENDPELQSQATAAKDEALRLMSLAQEREAECNKMQVLMQAKETEIDELALRCHQLLGENKKLQQRVAEADTRLLYAAELALSNPASLNNSKNSATSPTAKGQDGEGQQKEEEDEVCVAEEHDGEGSGESEGALEFRSDAETSILGDEAPTKKSSAVVEQPTASDTVSSEPLKAARKTLRPLPAKQTPSDTSNFTSTKRLSGELNAPPDVHDKENANNAAPAAVPTKKARKLFNPVQLPEDLTGDPFAAV